jgi:gamma-glutamyltranspeptidase/glutathione hydrolase
MTLMDGGKRLFSSGGRYVTRGDRFRNPELGRFLADLPADRGKRFYYGDIARQIARDMGKGNGLVTADDLAAYEVVERKPLEVSYRGRRLVTNPPPSFGGSLLAVALRLLESVSLDGLQWGSSAHTVMLASTMMEVERMRQKGCRGPADLDMLGIGGSAERIRACSRGTTHVSVADAMGNAASMTTSNGEGSGYIVPGAGIMLNNMLGEDDLHPDGFHAASPGLRVASMMSPSLLMSENRMEMVLGSGGSKRIRTAILQVLINVVDFGMDIVQAVEAPRIHWDGEILQVEPALSQGSLDALRARWPVNVWSDRNVYFGGVHAVMPNDHGGGDPRRGGNAVTVDLPRDK